GLFAENLSPRSPSSDGCPPYAATEFTQVLFATLFMELRGWLEVGRHLVAKAGRGGGKLNALVRRFRLLRLRASSCPSWRKLCHNEELQASLINTLSAVRMPPRIATSNLDLRAHLGSEPSISMFCASLHHLFLPVTANYLPVMAKSSPCYCPVPRASPIFLKPLLLKCIFLQKPVRRPPILPVFCLLPGSIRENRGAKPLSNPGLIPPSSLPSKLGWSPGDLRCVNAVVAALSGERAGLSAQASSDPPSLRHAALNL